MSDVYCNTYFTSLKCSSSLKWRAKQLNIYSLLMFMTYQSLSKINKMLNLLIPPSPDHFLMLSWSSFLAAVSSSFAGFQLGSKFFFSGSQHL